ncbi:MAG: nitroreductase family deazaflavin-dependent oxidoreductase [Chloroflexi bacterium]|jgi:deazaflavin-dependent oxidoreductase (nitroreductase family)|nr:nitroreductase family deazaflavin-dependent oxidoreductase [Dehalococcoidia bacterium]RUA21529.1 MAG: nitroreductase family deazaflavin-dependent oxidoreductase [Chloroflexota bacterium]PCJ78208.1 MAG: nitroreductase [Dehalococcoidia bacterium]RUA32910.1 MAG: nitroreductase family deazaflavin-dependent oxidoreductase [Chloroflexota bacterium]HIM62807.1 nitroreductase family deazaflavin-dependent oxidoreductase [Dehalococcoidia bacterium]|tara:strand:+ start:136 stop:573 length:438 start_codon:yes stop_codon:yes gene_type:complete
MAEYIPSTSDWVAKQVELYEGSGGTEGKTLLDTGLPVIIVTNTGRRTGAVRKTPLMRAVDGKNYILVASRGGAPNHPVWYYNLKAEPNVEIRDGAEVHSMRVREISDAAEKQRLWDIAVAAYPPYQEYQDKTDRQIPVFIAEPTA